MAKTKTRDEVMSEAYWTPKEKEDLNSKYSTSLVKENCNQEEMSDKTLPSDAYIVTYKIQGEFRNDLVRCHAKVNIFDMYYDKFGAGSIVDIKYVNFSMTSNKVITSCITNFIRHNISIRRQRLIFHLLLIAIFFDERC